MRRLPPLHCLQALEAVARLGSVVAAADELCVTASAISHRLRQLEVWLGQPLIARPQPLTLTPHAVQYAIAARAALAGLGRAAAAARRCPPAAAGRGAADLRAQHPRAADGRRSPSSTRTSNSNCT